MISAVPTENVATIASCASVVEGVSRSRNALLNGDTRNYDWDSGYTCHQLGSGAIVIQLAQPYSISSLRYIRPLCLSLLGNCRNTAASLELMLILLPTVEAAAVGL